MFLFFINDLNKLRKKIFIDHYKLDYFQKLFFLQMQQIV